MAETVDKQTLWEALENMTAARDSCLRQIGHLHAEQERLQARVAAQADVIQLARFVASNDDTRIGGMQGIYALRDCLARLDTATDVSDQSAQQQQAAEVGKTE